MSEYKLLPPSIFIVDKPKGLSSFDIIRQFKKSIPLTKDKIGHLGTLDPFATGMLLIACSGAARLSDYTHQFFSKSYHALGLLGVTTPSGDPTTAISSYENFSFPSHPHVISLLNEKLQNHFLGEYMQSPHSFSAAKFQGRALYKWAREGKLLTKEEKRREILNLEVKSIFKASLADYFPEVAEADASMAPTIYAIEFTATVSSGTYIRSLFADIAKSLNTIGTLVELKRTAIGHLSLEGSSHKIVTPLRPSPSTVENRLSPSELLPLPSIDLCGVSLKQYTNGMPIPLENLQVETSLFSQYQSYYQVDPDGLTWIYDTNTAPTLIGLGVLQKNLLTPLINWSARLKR
ncbi:MAG: hypothetical protein HQK50_11815 [Oligoflexia bacterium]|nr:hypothetical protein [Oligoflexia bacterium]